MPLQRESQVIGGAIAVPAPIDSRNGTVGLSTVLPEWLETKPTTILGDLVGFPVRIENRHSAFGLGIHRCLGSNLARLEVRIAVQEFVRHFPRFELADPASVRWSVGQIRGPRELPIRVLDRA